MRRMMVLLAVAALTVLVPVAHAAASDAGIVAAATAQERGGRLQRAFVLFGRVAKPTKAQTTHREHLGAALQAQATAAALSRAGDDAGAEAVLDAARAELDPGADGFVLVALADDAATAARRATASADAEARATIHKGDALRADERWDDAAALYKTVATKPAGTISASVRQTATVRQLRAERSAIEDEPGPVSEFFTSIWHTIRDALKWLLIPLLVGFGLWVTRAIQRRRPVTGQTSLALAEAGVDGKDQDRRDHALAVELSQAIQDVRYLSVGVDGSDVDERRDLDGTAAPLLDVGGGSLGPVDALGENVTVDVGPLKLSPLEFYYVVRWARARPGEQELRGTLRADEHGAELNVELCGPEEGDVRHWSARASGAGARAAVIREIAQRFVVESSFSYISTSWASFAAYGEALKALEVASGQEPSERLATLATARVALERALGHDAFNLLARLRLGAVLRTMGSNPEAAAQFARLRDDVLAVDQLPDGAAELVRRHPELLYVAMFNRAVALSKWKRGRSDAVTVQLAMLAARLAPATAPVLPVLLSAQRPGLIKALNETTWPTTVLDERDRERLYALVMASWAASLLATVERGADRSSKRLEDRRVLVRERLLEVHAQLVAGELAGPDAGTALRQAEAVLEDALARLAYLRRIVPEARSAARRALVLTPDLGNAHVTLAEVAMLKQGQKDDDWSIEAERHLTTALAISPEDQRARYLLGKLYKMTGDFPKAKEAFGTLPADWRSLDELGDVLLEEESYAEAVRCFVRAQARNPSGDYRAARLVGTVLALRGIDGARLRRRDGDRAIWAGERVVKAVDEPKKAEARKRLESLRAAVQELTGRGPAPEPPRSPDPPAA
jgi:tetratricopeptide (TPR) repeat protein